MEIDMVKPTPSSSGKTLVVAGTRGNAWLISGGVTHLRMAPSTVIHRESHLHMTDTAKIAENIPFHGKGLGPLLLNIEYVGVAA